MHSRASSQVYRTCITDYYTRGQNPIVTLYKDKSFTVHLQLVCSVNRFSLELITSTKKRKKTVELDTA